MDFNQEQLNFINSGICNLKLLGIPGGGKTRSIIGHIEANIRNKTYKKKTEYLIITFSRRAKDDFLKKGARSSYPSHFSTHNVRTIHSLSGKINNMLAIGRHHSIATTVIASKEALIGADPGKLKELNNIKMIYVDEAQDISEEQYEFIILLARRVDSCVCMVGDPNQSIYDFQGGKPDYLLNFDADKTIQLKINYRSTSALIDFFNEMLPLRGEHNLMTSGLDEEGVRPIVFAGTVEEILGDLIAELKSTKINLQDVLIMSSTRLCKENGTFYTNLGLSAVVNCLKYNEIPFSQNYCVDGRGSEMDTKLTIKDGHVNLMTVHGSKGLEFEKVIILNFQQKGFGRKPTPEDHKNFKYLWYVGMTRAKKELKLYTFNQYVKGVGKFDCVPFYELEKVPKDKYLKEGPRRMVFKALFGTRFVKQSKGVRDLLDDMKAMQEFSLENVIMPNCETVAEQIYSVDEVSIPDYQQFCSLYGLFMEAVFEYFYLVGKKISISNLTCIKWIRSVKSSHYIVHEKDLEVFNIIKDVFLANGQDQVDLNRIREEVHKIQLKNNTPEEERIRKIEETKRNILNFLDKVQSKTGSGYAHIISASKLKILPGSPEDNTDDIVAEITAGGSFWDISRIFKLILFRYQLGYEAKYLWNQDFSENINSLWEHIEAIKEFASQCDKLKFQVENKHPRMSLVGVADAIREKEIIEIKFSSSREINNRWIYQLFLYYNNMFPLWEEPPKLTVWNLLRGIKYEIRLKLDFSREDFLGLISRISGLELSPKKPSLCSLM